MYLAVNRRPRSPLTARVTRRRVRPVSRSSPTGAADQSGGRACSILARDDHSGRRWTRPTTTVADPAGYLMGLLQSSLLAGAREWIERETPRLVSEWQEICRMPSVSA